MWPGSQVRLAPPPQCEQRSSGDLEARPSPGLGGDRSGATAWIWDLRASPLIKFGGSNEREEPAAHESPALNGQEDGGVPLMRQESWGWAAGRPRALGRTCTLAGSLGVSRGGFKALLMVMRVRSSPRV